MTVVAALLIGLTLAMAVLVAVPTPVRVGRRIAPYVQTHRQRSGLVSDVAVAIDPGFEPQRGPIGSIARSVGRGLNRLVGEVIDTGDDSELRLRLRRAGVEPPTSTAYRAAQLRRSFVGAGLGTVLALVMGRRSGDIRVSMLLLVTGIGFLIGTISHKALLERKALRRRKEMQLSLYTVTQVLAVLARANRGPVGAVRHLTRRGHGPLIDELRIGIGWMERGSSAEVAFEQLGRDAPDPSTARLFRLIATATASGGNIARTLRAQADQLRKEHTENMEQLATKKRSAMVLPSIVVMVPVLLLYALAPGPGMLFGGGFG
jgi:Flp pilus assembly protein TadB